MRARIGILAAVMWFAGCATMSVGSHVETTIDFTRYVSYDWGPPDNLPVGDPRLDNNPFFNDYVQGAVEKMMAAKGYQRATADVADLLVHYHASVHQKLDVYTPDRMQGYCYGPDCEAKVTAYDEGTLVLDLVDTATNKVVWRGWARDTMDGVIDHKDRLEKQVDEAIRRMRLQMPRGGAALP